MLVRQAEKAPPALTPRLFNLKQGDRVFLGEKIAGHFTLETVKPTDNVVFLSTGTGEAPHNYMAWELFAKNHQGKILSACCVRFKQDLGYLAIHEELARRYPNYTYLSLTTREGSEFRPKKVYIQDLITSGQPRRTLGRFARFHAHPCRLSVRQSENDRRAQPGQGDRFRDLSPAARRHRDLEQARLLHGPAELEVEGEYSRRRILVRFAAGGVARANATPQTAEHRGVEMADRHHWQLAPGQACIRTGQAIGRCGKSSSSRAIAILP